MKIGFDHQPICIPGNATITVPGRTSKVITKKSYMPELAAYSNVLSGVMVYCNYVTQKAGQVGVIVINTTNRNICICQPLLATYVYEVELHPWQNCTTLHRKENFIKIIFQLLVPQEVEGGPL